MSCIVLLTCLSNSESISDKFFIDDHVLAIAYPQCRNSSDNINGNQMIGIK